MTTRDYLETLNNTKFVQRLIVLRNPLPIEEFKKPVEKVNWIERTKVKGDIFKTYLIAQIVIVTVVLVFVVIPFGIAHPPLGKSLFLSIFPVWVMSLSWMVGAWWAYDKGTMLFAALTFGGVPARFGVCLSWVWITLVYVPELVESVYVFGLMGFWIVFTIIEIMMILQMSNKLPNVQELESGWRI